MGSNWLATGAIAAGLGVLFGAFGAHGLKARVTPELLTVFETGVRYHLIHALALIAVGLAAPRWHGPWLGAAGWLFLAGLTVFSGSLYVMTLTGVRWLGAITPLGGLAMIAGWACLAIAALRHG